MSFFLFLSYFFLISPCPHSRVLFTKSYNRTNKQPDPLFEFFSILLTFQGVKLTFFPVAIWLLNILKLTDWTSQFKLTSRSSTSSMSQSTSTTERTIPTESLTTAFYISTLNPTTLPTSPSSYPTPSTVESQTFHSPLWKRVIAREPSRAASGYAIIWGNADQNKQEGI